MRIGIVNDVALVVEALRRALALNPAHSVAWTARDGAEAVRRCAEDRPDLVLMDLIMPGMDGVEATRLIMAQSPCAILVVTSSVGANAGRVFEAMGHGALDAVDTPALGSGNLNAVAAPLLAKINLLGRLIGDTGARREPPAPMKGARRSASARQLIAIGASAGGPAALETLLRMLPKDLQAGVVVVQHVDEKFAAGMADWLGQQSALPVRLAREGDAPLPGTVLLAGTGDHLAFKGPARMGYTPDPVDYVYRPSVDVFLQSVCRHWTGDTVGVLLTGMGRDGALGLKALRDKGCHTIAQDQATSAVYGMPKAAASLGAAVEILPLGKIAESLLRALSNVQPALHRGPS